MATCQSPALFLLQYLNRYTKKVSVCITIKRTMRRFFRKQYARNKTAILCMSAVSVLVLGLFAYTEYMQHRRLIPDPTTYVQLLQLVANAESKGNDNAYFGNAGNSSIDFTSMSIAEVMKWQADYVSQGSPSSAVGRYQLLSTTLAGLVDELAIDTNQSFDRSMQDRMAGALIERRGAEGYVNGELTPQAFAANLAKEWAALPRVVGENPEDSYYVSDGLNKSLVSVDEVLDAIRPISHKR